MAHSLAPFPPPPYNMPLEIWWLMCALKRYAHVYAPIIPLAPGTKGPPRGFGWSNATEDLFTIYMWSCCKDLRSCNWGMLTGYGVVTLDCDNEADEMFIRGLEQNDPRKHSLWLPPCTLKIFTRRENNWGYQRFYFMPPDTFRRKCEPEIINEIEVKGVGGLSMIPPSLHPKTGKQRIYTNDSIWDIPFAPQWLIDGLKPLKSREYAAPAHLQDLIRPHVPVKAPKPKPEPKPPVTRHAVANAPGTFTVVIPAPQPTVQPAREGWDIPPTMSDEFVIQEIRRTRPTLWECDPREIFDKRVKRRDRSEIDWGFLRDIAKISRNKAQTYRVFMASPRAHAPRLDPATGMQKPFKHNPQFTMGEIDRVFSGLDFAQVDAEQQRWAAFNNPFQQGQADIR